MSYRKISSQYKEKNNDGTLLQPNGLPENVMTSVL